MISRPPARAAAGDALRVDIGKGRALANNNPGNLEFHDQPGAKLSDDGRFARFRSPEDGMKALERDLRAKQTGRSRTGVNGDTRLDHFAAVWLGGADNPENDYATYVDSLVYVLRDLGVRPSTPIGQIPTWALADAVAYLESGTTVSRETLE